MTWGGKGAHECSGFLGILYRKGELHNMSCSLETRKCQGHLRFLLPWHRCFSFSPSAGDLLFSICVELLQEELV